MMADSEPRVHSTRQHLLQQLALVTERSYHQSGMPRCGVAAPGNAPPYPGLVQQAGISVKVGG